MRVSAYTHTPRHTRTHTHIPNQIWKLNHRMAASGKAAIYHQQPQDPLYAPRCPTPPQPIVRSLPTINEYMTKGILIRHT